MIILIREGVMYNNIILFVHLVNAGNFSQAAKFKKVNQSTITRRIQALEKTLNTRLIKRNSRHLALTKNGSILYENFKNYESLVNQLLYSVYNNSSLRGELIISCPRSLAASLLIPYLPAFARENPELQLQIFIQHQNISMEQQHFDLAVAPDFLCSSIHSKELVYTQKNILCCSPEYLSRYGEVKEIADLHNHNLIKLTDMEHPIDTPLNVYQERGDSLIEMIACNFRLGINHSMLAKDIILPGHMIGGLPESSILTELQNKTLVRVLPEYHLGYTNYYFLTKLDYLDPRYIKFLTFVKSYLR